MNCGTGGRLPPRFYHHQKERLANAPVRGLSTKDALYLAKSSSAALRIASLVGFFILSQYGDRPEI
jgi:hypothetical protein